MHGVLPPVAAHQVYVANHSSMIDFIILGHIASFSVVGMRESGDCGMNGWMRGRRKSMNGQEGTPAAFALSLSLYLSKRGSNPEQEGKDH